MNEDYTIVIDDLSYVLVIGELFLGEYALEPRQYSNRE